MKVYDDPWQGYYSPLFLVIHDYVIHPSLKVDALSKRLSRLGSCLLLIRGLSSLSVTCSPTWNAPLHPGSIQQTQLRERLTRTSKDVGGPQHEVNWIHKHSHAEKTVLWLSVAKTNRQDSRTVQPSMTVGSWAIFISLSVSIRCRREGRV